MEHIQRLHHIGMPTSKMDATVMFYQDLGAKVVFEKTDECEGQPIRVVLLDLRGTLIECYERPATAMRTGAIEHLAFAVDRVEELYAICKDKGYRLMEDCAERLGRSSYWPKGARWFIVYGPNEEKIEFCQEGFQ